MPDMTPIHVHIHAKIYVFTKHIVIFNYSCDEELFLAISGLIDLIDELIVNLVQLNLGGEKLSKSKFADRIEIAYHRNRKEI